MALTWSLEFKKLELKYTWAISRNASDFKINAFIKVSDGKVTSIGEAAPNIRYNETIEAFVTVFSSLVFPDLTDLDTFEEWLTNQKLPNSLRFGIESACVNFLAKRKGLTVSSFLGLSEPIPRNTAYTIPIMPAEKLQTYFVEYNLKRFKYIKIKVNNENMVSLLKEARKHLSNTFIIDANEAYTDPGQFITDIKFIADPDLAFVEQPFPSHLKEEYEYLKGNSPCKIFADESITDNADYSELKKGFHGVNIKLMKAGGYLNGIRLLKGAKSHGLETMIGCMVETGLGISSGFSLSSLADYLDLDSFMILKEDPFEKIHEKDGILFLDNQVNKPEFL